ncbi:hypothetical protein D3C86_1955340 [compost metagenome]
MPGANAWSSAARQLRIAATAAKAFAWVSHALRLEFFFARVKAKRCCGSCFSSHENRCSMLPTLS